MSRIKEFATWLYNRGYDWDDTVSDQIKNEIIQEYREEKAYGIKK